MILAMYSKRMDAGSAELVVLGILHLLPHPQIVVAFIQPICNGPVTSSWWNIHVWQMSKLTIECVHDRFDNQSRSLELLRWNGFVVIIDDVNLAFKRQSGLEDGRFCLSSKSNP